MEELRNHASALVDASVQKLPSLLPVLEHSAKQLQSLLRRCQQHSSAKTLQDSALQKLRALTTNSVALQRFQAALEREVQTTCPTLPPSRRLLQLSGPRSFVFYGPKTFPSPLSRVLILGEYHHVRNLCEDAKGYQVQEWLWDLAMDTHGTCLDIFTEDDYTHTLEADEIRAWGEGVRPRNATDGILDHTSPLQAVRVMFRSCRTQLRQCPASLRYHYIDVRTVHKGSALVELAEELDTNDFRIPKDDVRAMMDSYLFKNEYWALIRYLRTVPEAYMKGDFEKRWRLEFEPEIRHTQHLIQRQRKKSTLAWSRIKEIVRLFQPNVETLLNVMSLSQDIYCLQRLFSRFPESKMERGPKGCRSLDFQMVKNAIVYCGDWHAKFLSFFLETYFEVEPTLEVMTPHPDAQCIQLSAPFDFYR